MKFGIEVYEKLVELVRQHPCLYDASMSEHKDHPLQKNIWKQISKDLDEKDMNCSQCASNSLNCMCLFETAILVGHYTIYMCTLYKLCISTHMLH